MTAKLLNGNDPRFCARYVKKLGYVQGPFKPEKRNAPPHGIYVMDMPDGSKKKYKRMMPWDSSVAIGAEVILGKLETTGNMQIKTWSVHKVIVPESYMYYELVHNSGSIPSIKAYTPSAKYFGRKLLLIEI